MPTGSPIRGVASGDHSTGVIAPEVAGTTPPHPSDAPDVAVGCLTPERLEEDVPLLVEPPPEPALVAEGEEVVGSEVGVTVPVSVGDGDGSVVCVSVGEGVGVLVSVGVGSVVDGDGLTVWARAGTVAISNTSETISNASATDIRTGCRGSRTLVLSQGGGRAGRRPHSGPMTSCGQPLFGGVFYGQK